MSTNLHPVFQQALAPYILPIIKEDLRYACRTLAEDDLLKALQAMLTLHAAHHNEPVHAAARAAIRKATTGDTH